MSAPRGKRRNMVKFKMNEISLVGSPAQEGAGGVIMKSMDAAADDTAEKNEESAETSNEEQTTSESQEAEPETAEAQSSDETPTEEADNPPAEKAENRKDSAMEKEKEENQGTVTKDAEENASKDDGALRKELLDLKKELVWLNKVNGLSSEERQYFDALDKSDQESFIDSSAEERKVTMELHAENLKKDDPVVYTTDAGVDINKSAGRAVIEMAKQSDKTAREFAKMKEEKEALEFQKEADDKLSHLGGTSETRAAILQAVTKGIEDDDLRDEALKSLTTFDEDMKKAFTSYGVMREKTMTKDSDDPNDKLDELAKDFAKANKMDFYDAYEEVLKTAKGKELADQALAAAH